MAVLEPDAPNHGRNAIERAERGRPIGHRQSRLIAGDQRAGDKQKKGDASGENKKIVQRTIELCGGRLQNQLLTAEKARAVENQQRAAPWELIIVTNGCRARKTRAGCVSSLRDISATALRAKAHS